MKKYKIDEVNNYLTMVFNTYFNTNYLIKLKFHGDGICRDPYLSNYTITISCLCEKYNNFTYFNQDNKLININLKNIDDELLDKLRKIIINKDNHNETLKQILIERNVKKLEKELTIKNDRWLICKSKKIKI